MKHGLVSKVDGKWLIDGYPIHPCQSFNLWHDLSYKWISPEDVFGKPHAYQLEYNPNKGPWLYAVVEGIRDSRNEDSSW